jgi:ribosomal-protein-alanine N-acetyltransferase
LDEVARVYAWYADPEVVAPFDRYVGESLAQFRRSVEAEADDPASLAPRFGVERRAEGDLVGVVGHYRAHPVLEFEDVWYLLGEPSARGQGVGREAVGLLVDHRFRSAAIERVGATCDAENVASYRLVEGLGFRWEGTLRAALFHHGRWHDVRVYGITRSEWAGRARPG